MHAAFITLADHSYVAAARQGLAARNDSEQVLKIDPEYADAKMAMGIQQFAVASLPRVCADDGGDCRGGRQQGEGAGAAAGGGGAWGGDAGGVADGAVAVSAA